MPPSHQNTTSQQASNLRSQNMPAGNTESMARLAGIPPRLRNDESWVEISSQPSSSSLSSIGDEIVTTGLRVQHDPRLRRRRREHGPSRLVHEPRQTSTSSQEEYEESESEEDQVMTSSNEHILPTTSLPRPEYDAGSDSDDDDENATALGRRTEAGPLFTPQPNAFSHPPTTQRPGAGGAGSYFPPHAAARHQHPTSRAASRHQSYNHQADHDAALRASLTTLLSIGAAAARGLPKRNQNMGVNAETSNAPMGLRFVPESELMGPEPALANTSRPLSPSTRARSSPSVSSQEAVEKGKRKATAVKPTGEKTRALKKKRVQVLEEESLISPTLLTWVVSAGVLVLVSVVGFGAGYVIGREVGRQEAMAGLNGTTLMDSSTCGREAVRGSTGSLRKFKWGIGGAARAVVA